MMPGVMLREVMILGTPKQIQDQVQEFADIGIEYLVTSFSGPNELQSLKLFGETVLPKF
jgi:alkanesulfonate monooxygenase SsuD/methylene tetrahydromethanopterin reductase-like flavin-dependent oxidoreductase (luciferase family)